MQMKELFHAVFFSPAEKKPCILQYSINTVDIIMCEAFKCKKSLNRSADLHCQVRISLHSGPMLKIDCPVSHKPLTSPLPQANFPLSAPHPTNVKKNYKGKMSFAHPLHQVSSSSIAGTIAKSL
jgi:hypothetical protein